jgi:SPP1 family predicted phage head-tail adaptor
MNTHPTPEALRYRLTLEEPIAAPDGQGGTNMSYVAVGQVWAEVKPTGSREVYEDGRLTARITHRIRIRAREGLARDQRFIALSGQAFVIHSLFDEAGDRRFLTCLCEALTP